jgi:diguanylate cyclase (GGDEF)-like protein
MTGAHHAQVRPAASSERGYSELTEADKERILAFQQAILESIAHGNDHMEIVNSVCTLEEELVPNAVASVMLLDEKQLLNVYAAPSIPAEGIARLNGLRPGPGAGSCGNVVYCREAIFVSDTATDPRWRDLRQLSIDFDLMACWSVPIYSAGGTIVGTFALSSFERRAPSPFHLKLLDIGASIIGIVLERKAADAKIAFLAYHDALTELPNRVLARERLELAIAYAERIDGKVALLYFDLDNFKIINDSLGHTIGDALLKAVAARIGECTRETDTVGRLGGDEFLLVVGNAFHLEEISRVSEKILERMAEPFDIEGYELTTTVSMGVAVCPDDGEDFDTLLKKADIAMYKAKDAGRNTYRFHTRQMNTEALEHLTIRNGLRQALELGQFVLHFQPQINLASGRPVGAEALIRWQHPELGMVPPGRFISIAEDSGLIVPIGEWVLREACRQAVAWRAASGMSDLVCAVNLSARQFKRGNLEKSVTSALADTGLDPACLELELTESILLHDTDNVLATVTRLKAIGVKLSIDDFGTGYSSLSYLKRFAVDKL